MVLEKVKAELQEKSQLQEKRNICKQRWNELAFSLEEYKYNNSVHNG